ncbi:hypothetical protein C806_02924 [Lachnospiraceae bacterium 3-1]|nr:hypothetical protein C806_02924 [Lachnospiraceae bacterium 3-1]
MIRILIVDDQREEREGIAYLLEKYKYPVETVQASNGAEASRYIRSHEVDILFTDIKMPIMNGLDLAKEVNEYDPQIKIIIFSAYGEFEYAKQALVANAVSYLLKPIEIDEFRQLMDDVIDSINKRKVLYEKKQQDDMQNRKNLLYKVLTSGRVEEKEEERLCEILFPKENTIYGFLDIEFMGNYFERQEDEFLHFVKMYLGDQAKYIGIYPNKAFLILPYVNRKSLEEQLKKLLRDIKTQTGDECLILISSQVTEIHDLIEQLKRMNEIHMEVLGYGDQIIAVADYYNRTEYYAADVEIASKQLVTAIESKNPDLVREQNKKFISCICSLEKVSRLYIQNLLYSIVKAVYDIVPGTVYEKVLILAEALFQENDLKTMLKEYERIIEFMMDSLENEKVDESRIVQNIKNLVEKEYMKDISLNYVADKVNLAPAYVSYIFKKETNQTLVKFITDVKMQKAKQLLEEGNLKIVQIGRACGYGNQSYFNRLFKNYYGVTPKQYREKV